MVLCFEVGRETKDKMDDLVSSRQYRDYSELLAVSVANQFLFHNSKSAGERAEAGAISIPPAEGRATRVDGLPEEKRAESDRPVPANRQLEDSAIPPIFRHSVAIEGQVDVAPLPNDAFATGMEIPVDRWVFGQHNKLLPAKANVRALANLSHRDPKRSGVELDSASREIANAAARLGELFRSIDLQTGRSRDEAFGLAFPSSDPSNNDKSRLRYASQFVGAVSKEGRMTGLLIDLKLVNVDRQKPPRIRLTEPGRRFAELSNPLMDGLDANQQAKFSTEELEFMLGHISEHVPVEAFAYSVTLRAIAEGHNTPEGLDLALKKYLPERVDKPFTDAFLTTQRAGVISRMADLTLVTRARHGQNVTYVVTERGEEFIRKGEK
jgi:Arc/MetJ-type ribon-helix-helix transcriptional regulator